MSQNKHTPGPWSHWSGYNHVDKIEAEVTAEGGDIVIASYNHLIEEGEANASLITAAPDLLEALEESTECASILRSLIESIEAHGNYSAESTISFLNHALSCHRLSTEAIRKARGEQP